MRCAFPPYNYNWYLVTVLNAKVNLYTADINNQGKWSV